MAIWGIVLLQALGLIAVEFQPRLYKPADNIYFISSSFGLSRKAEVHHSVDVLDRNKRQE
ncbi:hypothetical protein QUB56_32615 [Microcoleus sp. AR_TQ3_B6]|uniref:hypothetical protein n=1 Tax=Microcoleus sp. AR_TQ3_B6 TaxID=3055284 RepID=UPI002FCFF21C